MNGYHRRNILRLVLILSAVPHIGIHPERRGKMKGKDELQENRDRFDAEIEEDNRRRDEFHREIKVRRESVFTPLVDLDYLPDGQYRMIRDTEPQLGEKPDGIFLSDTNDSLVIKDCHFNVKGSK